MSFSAWVPMPFLEDLEFSGDLINLEPSHRLGPEVSASKLLPGLQPATIRLSRESHQI